MIIKKLDGYMIRLFIAPFLVIFCAVFFVFIVQFFWSKIDELTGKNINIFIILKFVFYFGISIIPLITPVSILLTSIMTYGNISENQELTAIKSSGISLFRVMKPIFWITVMLSIGLYFLSDFAIPKAKRKAQELGYQILVADPSLRLKEGVFVNFFPDLFIKIDKKSEKNKNHLENIFIFFYGKNLLINTIFSQKGILIPNKKDGSLKIKLINGVFYSESHNNVDKKNKTSPYPYQIVTFDTLIQSFKVPKKGIKNWDDSDSYQTMSTKKLLKKIDLLKKEKKKFDSKFQEKNYNFLFERNSNSKKYRKMSDHLSFLINQLQHQKNILKEKEIHLAKYQLELQKKLTLPVTCILMFFTGAPLGALIRKGGMGLPIIMALTIFTIYHTLLTISQNQVEKAEICPWIGAWIPNFTFLIPVSIGITYKTVMNDFYI
ncbi:LptF/LptG family permease [Blattabacterium cuenoti]|uniref:LptF/LptG family permease n=1 Tax=Blattabacterium cuenoti TaxID=1653831 RepID=UPI00163B6C7E|nr:LptF/LptG family permease [Blattabacterium cuenoti]